MTDFATFAAQFAGYSRLDLIRMLWRLSATWERIAMVRGDGTRRARVAKALLAEHEAA